MKVVLPVVIWCVLSAIVATVAERKGHKGGLFLLISIVLSPLIGFIIVAFLTDKYKMTEARSRERRSVKQEWISKRVLELVEQGKNAADAKIQAEAEFSVRRDEIFSESENNDSPVRNGIIRPLACVAVIAIIIVCVVSLAMNSNKPKSVPLAREAPGYEKNGDVEYSIFKSWNIGSQGEGCVIVVPKENRVESKMKILGELLEEKARKKSMAFYWVFDSNEAAKLHSRIRNGLDLIGEEKDIYDNHFIGVYQKNANRNLNRFRIMLDGVNGSVEDCNY